MSAEQQELFLNYYITIYNREYSVPDLNFFIANLAKYKLAPEISKKIIVDYLALNYFKLYKSSPLQIDKHIKAYNNEVILERLIRDSILYKKDYMKYISLLPKDKQNSREWQYWTASALMKKAATREKGKAILVVLSKENGYYPMLAAHKLNIPYKLNQGYIYKAIPLKKSLPGFEKAIDELIFFNREKLTRNLWYSLDFAEKDIPGYITYAYQKHWYGLGVYSSIQLRKPNELYLRFPNAYMQAYLDKTKGILITKTFAQAIARQESAWNSDVKSHANAVGLMQLLPSTAKAVAKTIDLKWNENNLISPMYNITLGVNLLNTLLEKNDNNRIFAAIGYNAGSSRINTWLKRSNNTLDMDEFIATIPFNETRNYVMNTLAFDYYHQVLQRYNVKTMFRTSEYKRKY